MRAGCLRVSIVSAFFLALTVLWQPAATAAEARPLVMSVIQKESDYYGRLVTLIYDEAFRRIGRKLDVKYFPAKRSSLMVSHGRIDGDLARTLKFHREHPQLVPVSESPLTIRFVVFSADPSIKINGWQDLKESAYRIDYLRGSALIDQKLKMGILKGPLSRVDDWKGGLRKLFAGRSDLFVEFEGGMRYAMTRTEFQGKKIYLAGVLDEYTVHAFLQPQHEALAAELSGVLKEMKQEGLIAQFEQQAFSSGYAHRSDP